MPFPSTVVVSLTCGSPYTNPLTLYYLLHKNAFQCLCLWKCESSFFTNPVTSQAQAESTTWVVHHQDFHDVNYRVSQDGKCATCCILESAALLSKLFFYFILVSLHDSFEIFGILTAAWLVKLNINRAFICTWEVRIETKIVINSAFRILNKQNGCVPGTGGVWTVSDPHLFNTVQHCWLQWVAPQAWQEGFPPHTSPSVTAVAGSTAQEEQTWSRRVGADE